MKGSMAIRTVLLVTLVVAAMANPAAAQTTTPVGQRATASAIDDITFVAA